MENINIPQPSAPRKQTSNLKRTFIILIIIVIIATIGIIVYMSIQNAVNIKTTNQIIQGSPIHSENKLPSTWSNDAPTYPGAIIINTLSTSKGDEVISTTNDSISQVLDYFKNQLPTSGWKIVDTRNAGLIEAIKDTRELLIAISMPTKLEKATFEETIIFKK